MITTAKYQPGDLVCIITAMEDGPVMVVGVTEWLGCGVSYTIGAGTERFEMYGEELTPALMNGKQMTADDFGPGEGVFRGIEEEGGDED
jgi:hypothetical protein